MNCPYCGNPCDNTTSIKGVIFYSHGAIASCGPLGAYIGGHGTPQPHSSISAPGHQVPPQPVPSTSLPTHATPPPTLSAPVPQAQPASITCPVCNNTARSKVFSWPDTYYYHDNGSLCVHVSKPTYTVQLPPGVSISASPPTAPQKPALRPWSELLDYSEVPLPEQHEIICECGKDKHGFASHSTWCPKWTETVI